MADFGMTEQLGGGFWKNGPAPGQFHNFPNQNTSNNNSGIKRTTNPTTTGSSVLAIKFNGGVIIAADTLGSYGSMARFRDCERVMKVNQSSILGAGGDYADFQYMKNMIEERVTEDDCLNDGFHMTPKSLYAWLTRIMYHRRSKFDPLWNTVVVGGVQDGEAFLGQVDKIGCAFESSTIATGYGAHIALPLMRDALEKNDNMNEKEARVLIDNCLRILFYRDARSLNRYKLAVVTADGANIEGPFSSKADWSIANMIRGYE